MANLGFGIEEFCLHSAEPGSGGNDPKLRPPSLVEPLVLGTRTCDDEPFFAKLVEGRGRGSKVAFEILSKGCLSVISTGLDHLDGFPQKNQSADFTEECWVPLSKKTLVASIR